MAIHRSTVSIAMSYPPFLHDVIGDRLQLTCIVCFSGRLILSVAFQSLVPECGKMFQGAYGTCVDQHSPVHRFGGYPQSCH